MCSYDTDILIYRLIGAGLETPIITWDPACLQKLPIVKHSSTLDQKPRTFPRTLRSRGLSQRLPNLHLPHFTGDDASAQVVFETWFRGLGLRVNIYLHSTETRSPKTRDIYCDQETARRGLDQANCPLFHSRGTGKILEVNIAIHIGPCTLHSVADIALSSLCARTSTNRNDTSYVWLFFSRRVKNRKHF